MPFFNRLRLVSDTLPDGRTCAPAAASVQTALDEENAAGYRLVACEGIPERSPVVVLVLEKEVP